MPNPLAALTVAALLSVVPAPAFAPICAARLTFAYRDTFLNAPRKQRDKQKRFLAVDLKCPSERGFGVLELVKKNAAGDIVFVQSLYRNAEIERLIIDWGPSTKGFTRPVDLKRGASMTADQERFFASAAHALHGVNARVCEGDARARAEYARVLKKNRRSFDEPESKTTWR